LVERYEEEHAQIQFVPEDKVELIQMNNYSFPPEVDD
jgi:hypothetical protein